MFCKVQLNFVQVLDSCMGKSWRHSGQSLISIASAHSMSKAHRAELYDDHMRDSNWKKLWEWVSDSFIGSLEWITISNMAILALMLSKKFQKALEGFSETRAAFQA